MRLQDLKLRNFLSYGAADVPLREINMAALVGENGAGKSALLDAVTFAVYGCGRAATVDDFIRRGERVMGVELVFALGGDEYRVVRSRGLQGGGKSALELARRGEDGGWVPLTAESIRQTEERIRQLLRMDYETFVASCFVLQGRADEFTARTPAERKAVLASVLGLDLYDDLQAAAKQEARARQGRADAAGRELDSVEAQLVERPGLEERQVAVAARVSELTGQMATAETGLGEAQRAAALVESKAAGVTALQERLASVRREIVSLEEQKNATPARRERLVKILDRRDDILKAGRAEADVKASLAELELKADRDRALRGGLQTASDALAGWQRQHEGRLATLRARVESARRQASLLEDVQCDRRDCRFLVEAFAAADGLLALGETLAAEEGATSSHLAQIEGLQVELVGVGYDPEAHRRLRAQAGELERWTRLRPELDQAEAALPDLDTQEKALGETIDQRRADAGRLEAELREAEAHAGAVKAAQARLKEAGQQVDNLRRCLASEQRALGEVEGRLRVLDELAGRQDGLRQEVARETREVTLYGRLAVAFGRNGVPALIIENAIPQIEVLANDLLGRMTGGRMSVRLVTQRETKTAGVVETLDIIIADELGERPYAMWSGAERFEVDISLRVAISKFLARRAGTRLEVLVIDEGIGALDGAGRLRFLDAIQTVASDFSQVLVITHIDEVKDAFPQRIEVTKGADGSQARVVA